MEYILRLLPYVTKANQRNRDKTASVEDEVAKYGSKPRIRTLLVVYVKHTEYGWHSPMHVRVVSTSDWGIQKHTRMSIVYLPSPRSKGLAIAFMTVMTPGRKGSL